MVRLEGWDIILSTFLSAWVNRGKARVKTKMDEDDIATKIQSGYKGMVAREEFKDLKNTK